MAWEPTTRGVSPSKEICTYKDCRDHNTNTGRYVVDVYGPRFFCDAHWVLAGYIFRIIKECEDCHRNHKADWDRNYITYDSVKYQNKWWELCDYHWSLYDDMVMIILPPDED